jgi:hypothetical protein
LIDANVCSHPSLYGLPTQRAGPALQAENPSEECRCEVGSRGRGTSEARSLSSCWLCFSSRSLMPPTSSRRSTGRCGSFLSASLTSSGSRTRSFVATDRSLARGPAPWLDAPGLRSSHRFWSARRRRSWRNCYRYSQASRAVSNPPPCPRVRGGGVSRRERRVGRGLPPLWRPRGPRMAPRLSSAGLERDRLAGSRRSRRRSLGRATPVGRAHGHLMIYDARASERALLLAGGSLVGGSGGRS